MKYKTKVCDDNMTFQDCELAILRHAVDESEEQARAVGVRNAEIDRIIDVLEDFLIRKQLVCYGGTAINNILPREAQFYNRDIEIPDYDFYSPHAMEDAIELADIYAKKGYAEVEAKAGVHFGTYKVFVNFTPIADITYIPESLFSMVKKESISVAGIKYSPPDFLRMNMYLELSRPKGDVSRWEKVLKRLTILNEHYPFKVEYDCHMVDFQRRMTDIPKITDSADSEEEIQQKIYTTIRDAFIDQGVVFFGGYASGLYSKYMPIKQRRLIEKVPDFDVLYENPNRVCLIIQERLSDIGVKNVKINKMDDCGEIIPVHYQIRIGNELLAHVYEPLACHSYNEIEIDGRKIRVGTIDTLLTFYLAFKYVNRPYYNPERLMCMAKFLFDVQQENRLEQRGILKRFSINCVGKQLTLDDIRVEKNEKFKELANKRGTKEYNSWFLKYNPSTSKKSKSIEEDTEEADSPETPPSSETTPKTKKNKKSKKTKKSQKTPAKTTTKHKRSKPKDAFQKLFSKSSNN
uniref:Poly(A) polymerase catalytic subunit domain-containing protein n=1 Tax=viral metagenome TaxID=1070528 RepID=A0A6C0HWE0_9ZZZZ